MSTARWETSQRPLFVKSVWLNGYRHAILSKEDPVVKNKPIKRIYSGKQTKSAHSKYKSRNSSDAALVIPAVQLLNVLKQQNYKRKNQHTKKNLIKSFTFHVLTRDSSASPPVTTRNTPNNKDMDLTPNTKHMPLHCNHNQTSNNKTDKTTKPNTLEQSNLMDRVLLWLDLAGKIGSKQSDGNLKSKENLGFKINKRVSTAHAVCNDKSLPSTSTSSNIFIRKCTKKVNLFANNCERSSSLDSSDEDDLSALRSCVNNEVPDLDNHLVTSQMEIITNCATKNFPIKHPVKKTDLENIVKIPSEDLSKRQVHIFMPYMKDKFNELNSLISVSSATASNF